MLIPSLAFSIILIQMYTSGGKTFFEKLFIILIIFDITLIIVDIWIAKSMKNKKRKYN